MHRFWDDIIEPIFKEFNIKNIVEIGSKGGDNTCKMINYCMKNDAFIHCIDPAPEYDYKNLEEKYPNYFKQYNNLSLDVLGDLKNVDAVLIDGDHNWYTVFNELKLISDYDKLPIIMFHDISWPYGRRDLYYNPDTIPEKYRKPYLKKGIIPNQSDLDENGINSHLYNATMESNDKNGVLTAIEDFIEEYNGNLILRKINIFNGFGILLTKEQNNKLNNSKIIVNAYDNLLSLGEEDRINHIINFFKFRNLFEKEHLLNIKLSEDYQELKEINFELNKTIKDFQKNILEKNNIISNKDNHIIIKNKIIKKYSNSFSWKITRPFRFFGSIIRKINRKK